VGLFGSLVGGPCECRVFFFDKSMYYIQKKKRKALLSTQERECKAPQAYIGNPNQQPNEKKAQRV
jgi:hypothetical protein